MGGGLFIKNLYYLLNSDIDTKIDFWFLLGKIIASQYLYILTIIFYYNFIIYIFL